MMRLTAPALLPALVDLEAWCGPKKDQQDLGACTAFAGCGMREFLYRKYADWEWVALHSVPLDEVPVFSPLFLYYLERKEDNTLGQGDTGSYGRTSVAAMRKYGLCLESEDPYKPYLYQNPPTEEQINEALKFRSGAYHRIFTVEDMKSCLASGYVFVIGFTVYESFEQIGKSGLWKPPDKKREQILGGHEVLAIGYSDEIGAFKVRNSWGSGWAASGNFWFPYECAADHDILMDAWIQHLGKPW